MFSRFWRCLQCFSLAHKTRIIINFGEGVACAYVINVSMFWNLSQYLIVMDYRWGYRWFPSKFIILGIGFALKCLYLGLEKISSATILAKTFLNKPKKWAEYVNTLSKKIKKCPNLFQCWWNLLPVHQEWRKGCKSISCVKNICLNSFCKDCSYTYHTWSHLCPINSFFLFQFLSIPFVGLYRVADCFDEASCIDGQETIKKKKSSKVICLFIILKPFSSVYFSNYRYTYVLDSSRRRAKSLPDDCFSMKL